VASINAGNALEGSKHANGIAEDAQLHVVDLATSGSSLNVPGSPRKNFQSMDNGD